MATDKKAKEMKSLVEAILAQKGESYDEWLNQRHMEFLFANSNTVLTALKQVSADKN